MQFRFLAYEIRIACLSNFNSIGMELEFLLTLFITPCLSITYKLKIQAFPQGDLIVLFFFLWSVAKAKACRPPTFLFNFLLPKNTKAFLRQPPDGSEQMRGAPQSASGKANLENTSSSSFPASRVNQGDYLHLFPIFYPK